MRKNVKHEEETAEFMFGHEIYENNADDRIFFPVLWSVDENFYNPLKLIKSWNPTINN